MLTWTMELNNITIKTLRLFHHQGRNYVEECELREDKKSGKPVFPPVFFQSYDKYDDARTIFMGRVARASYESGGNNIEPNGWENIFINGSLQRRSK